jgi:transcription initiation factor TFIIIB Brf1 subunit/transcription initiation factor TFIIB
MADLWPTLHKQKGPPIEQEDLPEFTEPTSYSCATCEDDGAIETIGTEVVCTRCGTLIDIPLEWAAEYRWFSADAAGGGADPSRCGFPVNHLMPESSLGTMILGTHQTPMMRRIKRYHMWNLMPYRERTLWTVFESLQVRASNAGISTAVLEEAKELYAQLTASAICRGQNQRDAMLAACLWESLKRHDSPRMPKDIAEIFNIPLKHVTKGLKQFQHLLAIRTSGQMTDTYAVPHKKVAASVPTSTDTITSTSTSTSTTVPAEPKVAAGGAGESAEAIAARAFQRRAIWQKTAARTTSYEDFIVPFLTNLSAPRATAAALEAYVRHICARTEELGVVPENTPPSLTASVIAFCCQELGIRIENTEIARVCSVSVVTIQKCLKRMAPWKAKLLEGMSGSG